MTAAFIPMKIRTCVRCGHQECPCCRDWCDQEPCLSADEERPDLCVGLECEYEGPADEAGYARLDQAEEELGRAGVFMTGYAGIGFLLRTGGMVASMEHEENFYKRLEADE